MVEVLGGGMGGLGLLITGGDDQVRATIAMVWFVASDEFVLLLTFSLGMGGVDTVVRVTSLRLLL